MGRVYDVKGDPSKGEIPARGVRCYAISHGGTHDTVMIQHVTRVEFEEDTDTGPALVTVLVEGPQRYIAEPDLVRVATASFRCFAAVRPFRDPIPCLFPLDWQRANKAEEPLSVPALSTS